MDIAVAAIDDIAHDSRKRRTIEPVTIDASPHIGERFQSGRMRHLDFIAIGSAQQRPRRLRHADLVKRKHPLALDLKQGRVDMPLAMSHQHLRAGRQSFGPANVAIRTHDDNHLMLAMEPQPSNTVARPRGRQDVLSFRHSSNT